ncbi:MAG TPA: folate-binding protein [Chromatiales bacterium]|nr:folate-binding protein [Thiotrichales bacterium]HIP69004.1 folate-binding protein [Chromatiales bacterium]
MKPDWQTFLIDAGAEFSEQIPMRVESYGSPIREQHLVLTGDTLCDLSHYGLIEAHGEDAETFLQNQLTNDIRQINPSHSQLNAYCTPKGRMLAIMRILKRGDSYYLKMPHKLIEGILKRLQTYVLMSKVTLEDANDALVRFGFAGPEAEKELEQAVGGFPKAVDEVLQTNDLSIIRIAGTLPRFEIYAELEPAQTLWDKLNVRGAPVGAAAWELLDVLSGTPEIYPETQELFVPQMANLQLIDGVSFQKGCYPGQEIVARMHYLGKLKRRMYRLHFDTDELPAPGTEIFTAENKEPVGSIVSSAANPQGGSETLAVLMTRYVDEASSFQLAKPDGPAGEISELPYEFEQAS